MADKSAGSTSIPVYTITLVGFILLVFAFQFLTSNDPLFAAMDRPSANVAGFDKLSFLLGHQYWRILTGATLHSGVLHVLMNCYAFYSFGRIVEMLTNRAHLALVFLLSAIGGGVLSLVFMPDGISVGASGGIVGLIGYLLVYAFRRRKFISPAFRKNLLINIGFILFFGLALYQVVDNFGHIGGFITGAIYGLVMIPSDERVDPREASPVVEIAGVAAVGAYIAGCLFSVLLILRVI